MSDVLVATVVSTEVFSACYLIAKYGAVGTFEIIKDFIQRVFKGPQKPTREAQTRPCEVKHKIASLETEIYGEILSPDVAEHMKEHIQ